MAEQGIEGGPAFQGPQVAEDFSEIRGMLLLQEVQQVGGRTNPLQSLD